MKTNFVYLNNAQYPIDSDHERETARIAMLEADLSSAPIYAFDGTERFATGSSFVEERCAYCERVQTRLTEQLPATNDDASWAALATQHEPACKWLVTRAHARDLSTVEQIKGALLDCLLEARTQGLLDGEKWEARDLDFEAVCDALGRKPSRSEWTEAGFPHVGEMHCAHKAPAAAVDLDFAVGMIVDAIDDGNSSTDKIAQAIEQLTKHAPRTADALRRLLLDDAQGFDGRLNDLEEWTEDAPRARKVGGSK